MELAPGGFEEITAFEVLEHVQDLPQTMKNFLDLLQDGGRLILSVPYELSRGAWQDPTHLRGFNENSWIYYTEWAWYLGWRNERFELEDLTYILSPQGKEQVRRGKTIEQLTSLPRAIDRLRVILRKRPSTAAEVREYDEQFRAIYQGPSRGWSLFEEGVNEWLRAVQLEPPISPRLWRSLKLKLFVCTRVYWFYKVLNWLGLDRGRKNICEKRSVRLSAARFSWILIKAINNARHP